MGYRAMDRNMREAKEQKKNQKKTAGSDQTEGISRRKFLSGVATSSAAVAIVPRHVLGRGFTPPSDLLNIAAVGVGGMGRANLINLASQNIVALCDVDWGYTERSLERLDTDIQNLQKRLDQPAAAGQPPSDFDRAKATARIDAMRKLKTVHVPKVKRYKDYREMLERQKDIDGVVVATADLQ